MGQARSAAKAARRPALRQSYLFGAIYLPGPRRRVLPCGDADMMQLHLEEISRNVLWPAGCCMKARKINPPDSNRLEAQTPPRERNIAACQGKGPLPSALLTRSRQTQ
jgi:hypothetical protein